MEMARFKISEDESKESVRCFRMKQDSDESIRPNCTGVQREYDLRSPAVISGTDENGRLHYAYTEPRPAGTPVADANAAAQFADCCVVEDRRGNPPRAVDRRRDDGGRGKRSGDLRVEPLQRPGRQPG